MAVDDTYDPGGAPASTCTVIVNPASAAAARSATSQVTSPLSPTAGVEHEKAGPLIWVSETKVAPAGSATVSVTEAAGSGPRLAAVIANVMSVSAVVSAGPLAWADRSALSSACARAAGAAQADSRSIPITTGSPARRLIIVRKPRLMWAAKRTSSPST